MEYGLRIGELIAVQKDCITETHVIIKRAFSESTLKGTKTNLEREYALTKYAREILKQNVKSDSLFVFTRDDKGQPYRNKDLNRIWREASAKTGIKIKLYNAIRHSLGCQLLDMGYDLDHVRQQLGHTDITTTKRYAVRQDETLKNALENRRGNVIEFPRKKNESS